MSKKPSFYDSNRVALEKLCLNHGYEYEFVDPDEMQMRVFGATHIIDIWPSRMVYHRVSGEIISSKEPYHRGLKWQFNKKQVSHLLQTGEYIQI